MTVVAQAVRAATGLPIGINVLRNDALAAPLANGKCRVAGSVTAASANEGIEHLVNKTVERFGSVDVLVNNVGGSRGGQSWDTSDEDWAEQLPVQEKENGL